jgi:hypothetical protein
MFAPQPYVTREALIFSAIFATFVPTPFCTPAVRPTAPTAVAQQHMSELWRPTDIAAADAFNGPWGAGHGPDPKAVYTFVHEKKHGVSPGLSVRDPRGVEWSVKEGEEGPVEVTLSRVLSAIGYHQPPVYFLPTYTLHDAKGRTHIAGGGRFRPHDRTIKERGEWSWQQNPFVGTKPYQGLLVILLMFDSSDLKNSNNSLYELKEPREGATQWYVVRDIGTALGETGRLDPKRSNAELFERQKFIIGHEREYVEFSYHGWHQELFRRRITDADVGWASDLLGRLSDQQWADAFRAGAFEPDVAQRFIARVKEKIEEGRSLRATLSRSIQEDR